MTTPYRDQQTSLAQMRRGSCPWCREAVSFEASDTSAVCDRCGARYDPAAALITRDELAPVVLPKSRVGYYTLLTVVAAGGVVLVPLAFALVIAAAAMAVGIYLGLGLPNIPRQKQLPPADKK